MFLQMSCGLFLAQPPDSGLEPPERYRAVVPGKKGIVPALDWWRSFRSPELTRLVERAITANYDIAAAVARIQQADAQLRVQGSLLLPTGGFNGSRTQGRTSAAASGSPGPHLPEQHLWSVGVTASYELDFWGKNAALVLAAERNAKVSRFDRDVVELSVVSAVVNTYFAILSFKDQLRIAQDNVRTAQRIQSILKQRVDAGTSTTVDLVQQDYIVAQQRIVIPQLTKVLQQNIAALATLLGEPPETIVINGRGLAGLIVPQIAPGLPSELLLQRPDIREAEARLAAAAANLASARVALFPSVQITGQRGFESLVLKTLITPQAAIYQVAENVTQPIFDLPRLLGQIDVQEGVQRELLENYRQSIIKALTDVEQALIAVRETASEERLSRQAVEIARRGYALLEAQLAAGNIDLTTMLNTQRTQFEALNQLVGAQLERFQAATALYQALGGGWSIVPDVVPSEPQVIVPVEQFALPADAVRH
jgi:NodT family efflux transporter outer membrane factor (OMF) lipoprotein